MKTTLFAVALAITLSLSAAAAEKPAMHLNRAGDPSAKPQEHRAFYQVLHRPCAVRACSMVVTSTLLTLTQMASPMRTRCSSLAAARPTVP